MKRPDVPAMDELEAALHAILGFEQAIKDLKQRLPDLVLEISRQVPEQDRRGAARYLYWQVPGLPVDSIRYGMLRYGENSSLFGVLVATNIQCDRCSRPVSFRSRTHREEVIFHSQASRPRYAEGYRVLCDPCWTQVQADRKPRTIEELANEW